MSLIGIGMFPQGDGSMDPMVTITDTLLMPTNLVRVLLVTNDSFTLMWT